MKPFNVTASLASKIALLASEQLKVLKLVIGFLKHCVARTYCLLHCSMLLHILQWSQVWGIKPKTFCPAKLAIAPINNCIKDASQISFAGFRTRYSTKGARLARPNSTRPAGLSRDLK